ncbi:hypothetical protein XNW1_4530032 [Xenorhabdus nematophila str. Websteri]|nr:hypothetical protein XNW1_4530032 [Xenorhabdus nematophila str. Websteri]
MVGKFFPVEGVGRRTPMAATIQQWVLAMLAFSPFNEIQVESVN